MNILLFELTKILTTTFLITIIPLIIGFTVKRPIPTWACWLVTVIIFVAFVIIPLNTGTGNVISGFLGALGSLLFLYYGSRRIRKKQENSDNENDS